MFELIQHDGEKRELLVDFLTKLPRNSSPLLFLRGDEFSSNSGKSFFRELALGYIQRSADVAGEGAISVDSGHAGVHDPTVIPLLSAQAIFRRE